MVAAVASLPLPWFRLVYYGVCCVCGVRALDFWIFWRET